MKIFSYFDIDCFVPRNNKKAPLNPPQWVEIREAAYVLIVHCFRLLRSSQQAKPRNDVGGQRFNAV